MSEPSSRSGEPDRFAAAGRVIGYYESCHGTSIDDAPLARLEITNARDRERVCRELITKLDGIAQTYRCDWGTDKLVHISESDWDDVKKALAEVAKMGG